MTELDEYEEHMDWYEDGYCSECDETWNIDSHAWHCPTCDAKLSLRQAPGLYEEE